MIQISDEQIESWLKNHIVSSHAFYENNNIEVLVWEQPGTPTHRIEYLISGNNLFIAGDLGHAVFSWAYPVGLKGISKNRMPYLMEKMEASEGGRSWREWDGDVAKEAVVNHFMEMGTKTKSALFRDFSENNGFDCLANHDSWINWLDKNNRGENYFGCECWEWIYDIGNVYPVRARAWFIGLRMAMEQLEVAKNENILASGI